MFYNTFLGVIVLVFDKFSDNWDETYVDWGKRTNKKKHPFGRKGCLLILGINNIVTVNLFRYIRSNIYNIFDCTNKTPITYALVAYR